MRKVVKYENTPLDISDRMVLFQIFYRCRRISHPHGIIVSKKGGTVKYPGTVLFLVFVLTAAVPAAASECINCHTNVEKLKAIAKNLPQPEASAESAGKG